MATNGTVLRFRALYVPAVLWLLALGTLAHLTGSSGAALGKANKSSQDPSAYRSYHFVLLVKSNDPNKTNVTAGNVSEELVIMPADAELLEKPTGGAFELKPQLLPGHITSRLVKKYHSNNKASTGMQLKQISPASISKQLKNASTLISTAEPSILLHAAPHGSASKKQRFPKKATPAVAKSKQLKDKVTIHRLEAKAGTNLRQLSLADVDLAPYELVATSKSLHGQSRTVRKTPQKAATDEQQQQPQQPRYEVIGTFRDAHVPRERTRRQSTTEQENSSA